jgi:2-polyprenyl-3-methyl-5-hydroxy-6-metoxy-1,4-benzoquinol methylase
MAEHSSSENLDYDNVGGNYYDKYGSRNPIARALMNGFLEAFDALSAESGAKTAYEAGCGEGMLSLRLVEYGLHVKGSDVEGHIVEEANRRAAELGHDPIFATRNLLELSPEETNADLIVCCEVLEHIPNPSVALDHLARLTQGYLLVSVPREPLWRILNMSRGKYLTALGNTPGHVNHWSPNRFIGELGRRFDIVAVRKPLPWTMVLCMAHRTQLDTHQERPTLGSGYCL